MTRLKGTNFFSDMKTFTFQKMISRQKTTEVSLNNEMNKFLLVLLMEMYRSLFRSNISLLFLSWVFRTQRFGHALFLRLAKDFQDDYLVCFRYYDVLLHRSISIFQDVSQSRDDVHVHNLGYRGEDVPVKELKYSRQSRFYDPLSNSNVSHLSSLLYNTIQL